MLAIFSHAFAHRHIFLESFPGGSVVKNSPANAGDIRDVGSVPGLGRPPGGGHSNPLQYSCLKNPMHRGAWQAIVHEVTKSQTRLSNFHFTLFVSLPLNHQRRYFHTRGQINLQVTFTFSDKITFK